MSRKVQVVSTVDIEAAAMMDAEDLAEIHKDKALSNKESKHSFYMQELEAASKGDKDSREWAASKGFDPAEYKMVDDDNEDAEKLQMAAIYTAMSYGFTTKDRAAYKCLLVDNMMKQSEDFINADK